MIINRFLTAVTAVLFIISLARADPLDHWNVRGTNTLLSSDDLYGALWANDLFVAVGASAGTAVAFISPDGINWRGRLADGPGTLRSVAYGSNMFVAVGYRTEGCTAGCGIGLSSGSNGEVWFERGSFPHTSLSGVAFGNGRFVAVGGASDDFNGAVIVSTNGFDWNRQNLRNSGLTNAGAFTGVTFANGLFVAVTFSPGNAYTSVDGMTWTNRGSVPGMPRAIIYADGTFLIAGGPQIFTGGANVVTSFDLETWTWHSTGGPNYNSAIAHGGGAFVVVGNGPGILSYSRNTLDWTRLSLGDFGLSGVAYGRGTFVIVGGNHIMQSDVLPTARLTAIGLGSGGFALNVRGEEGLNYRVQTTSDVAQTNWLDLIRFTSSTNLVDTTATNLSQRFYRAVSP